MVAQNVNSGAGDDNEALLQGVGRIESVTQNSADTSIVVKTILTVDGSTVTLDDGGVLRCNWNII